MFDEFVFEPRYAGKMTKQRCPRNGLAGIWRSVMQRVNLFDHIL
jgi:hypothetical protein